MRIHLRREQEQRHGVLVGRDTFGNAYYENRRYQSSAPQQQRIRIRIAKQLIAPCVCVLTRARAHTQTARGG
jgi:hypothetical protein